MIADAQRINNTLAILLQSILPIAIPVSPSIFANRLTTNSGIEVPKDTIVSQMTIEDILALLARETEPSTRKLAPLIKNTKPTTNRIYVSIRIADKKMIKSIRNHIFISYISVSSFLEHHLYYQTS